MKLVILGGGGFRVPLVYDAVAGNALAVDGAPAVSIGEVVLYDNSEQRLGAIERVVREHAAGFDNPPAVGFTTDLREALEGADFIFSAIRVGGTEGRIAVVRVSLLV